MSTQLDTIVCEWCPESTPATTKARVVNGIYREYTMNINLCTQHANEAASDFTKVNLYELNPEPTNAYEALEAIPSEMKECTVAQLELGERYGVPYPVCGDLTARKRKRWDTALLVSRLSWTGHDPDGNQY